MWGHTLHIHQDSSIPVVILWPLSCVENGFWTTLLMLAAGIKLAAGLTLLLYPGLLIHPWLRAEQTERWRDIQRLTACIKHELCSLKQQTDRDRTGSSRWTTWGVRIWTWKALDYGKICLSLWLGSFPPSIEIRVVLCMLARQILSFSSGEIFYTTASEFLLKGFKNCTLILKVYNVRLSAFKLFEIKL